MYASRSSFRDGTHCLTALLVCSSLAVASIQPLPLPPTQVPVTFDPTPDDCERALYTVPLPQNCDIEYGNGTRTTASWYQTSSCSNCLCTSARGPCSQTRCCCTAVSTTSLAYQCPDYHNRERVWVSNLATRCQCIPCIKVEVSFLIRVLNSTYHPVLLAEVTIDEIHSHVTDTLGYVGFTVPAMQATVHIDVCAAGYDEYSNTYFVIPGRVNRLEVVLIETRVAVVHPPPTPFLVHTHTLSVTPLPAHTHFISALTNFNLSSSPDQVNLYVYFPAKSFSNYEQVTLVSRSIGEAGVHSMIDDSGVPLFSSGTAGIDVQDEYGCSMEVNHNGNDAIGVLAVLPMDWSHLCHNLYHSGTESFEPSSNIILQTNDEHLKQMICAFPLLTNQVVYPVTFILATPVNSTRYISVKARDPFNLLETFQPSVTVTSKRDQSMCSLTSGLNSCLLVPSTSPLFIRLGGLVTYVSSPVTFPSLTACQERLATLNGSVTIDLVHDYCPKPSLSLTPSHKTQAHASHQLAQRSAPVTPFCSVRVAIVTCMDMLVQLVSTYDSEMNVQTFDGSSYIVTDEAAVPDDGESGSGSGSGDLCGHTHYHCVSFPCGAEVMIEVKELNTNSYTDICLGSVVPNRGRPSLENSLEGTGRVGVVTYGEEHGVYSSVVSLEVADELCSEGRDTGLLFVCYEP